ncbi:MAG: OmpA family protein [Pseudomonadota bacterium]|nr:OmpA family protein [Pseudomonadota bacterium]
MHWLSRLLMTHHWPRQGLLLVAVLGLALPAIAAESTTEEPVPPNSEHQMSVDEFLQLWAQEDDASTVSQGDVVETEKAIEKQYTTRKLKDVVPPIPFQSGEAEIPQRFVGMLREVLNKMKDRTNVRLHFIGHTDSDRLSGQARQEYGDNYGLSRARAEIAALFFQRALDLPPEAISYDGAGASKPIASNATAAGKARNRRVEVEVWYDEVSEKVVDREVVKQAEIKRVKVCRMETVCKIRYKQGYSKRVRLKNLVAPLRMEQGQVDIPARFLNELRRTLVNLRDKNNVMIRFIGHTDNLPLGDRALRIYGDHLALSKANARRVALVVQEQLNLPDRAISSDGKGDSRPVASNDSASGRALNRRIEVEFWYDDPLEVMNDEIQACPEDAAAETVTRVYEPPTGPLEPIYFRNGDPQIPRGYASHVQRLMEQIAEKTNVRLRFIGYTSNERLERRTAMLYGDDIGLSTARARRVMQQIRDEIALSDQQVEVEGRGYVQTDEVIARDFDDEFESRVVVQIVYDELAILDETEGMDITRINRETEPKNPYALNLMRITVDGEPLHDPHHSSADIQRCTDVALDKTDIRFRFDPLQLKPRLNVTAWPRTISYLNDPASELMDNRVRFRAYSNYASFIERSEVRLFEKDQSTRDEPLAVIELDADGYGQWQPRLVEFNAPLMTLHYVLRVYDEEGHFDETEPQPLWIVDQLEQADQMLDSERELRVGYGENRLTLQNIPLQGGTVRVDGKAVPDGHDVWLAGQPVPVSDNGEFVAETILPGGLHSVEVSVLDEQGNGELFLRDLDMRKSDWFYVGMADITAARDSTNGPAELVTGDTTHYDNDWNVDGQLAFFLNGKFGEKWQLTASADTREGPINEIFSNFTQKSPDAVFRRLDPDYYYPTFADDSSVEELAPTMGKFYVKLKKDEDYGLWGNFDIDYLDSELAQVDRSLYGGNLHLESDQTTGFGEQRYSVDGFAADPGTVAARDEYRGTGGSLYFLNHQDITIGSEKLRVEVRDKDSGIVIGVQNLTPGIDYDIDYIQGRVLLSEPLSSTASDNTLVEATAGDGNPAYLVARYEYTPGFTELNQVATGGRAHYWFNDQVKLGITNSSQDENGSESTLNGLDLTLRKNSGTWLRLEAASSEGAGTAVQNSLDGGFTFDATDLSGNTTRAGAQRIEAAARLEDVIEGARGHATFYNQRREAGYSAPGQLTPVETNQFGGSVDMPLSESLSLGVKADKKVQKGDLETSAVDVSVGYQLNDHWQLTGGSRFDSRRDDSPVVPTTQTQGKRTDVAFKAEYNSKANWTAYGFTQLTADTTENREQNDRLGIGGSYRVSSRFLLDTELSEGDTGTGARIGSEYLLSDRSNLYLNYALENERTDNGVRSRKGNLSSGFRTRYSDSASVYVEERYTHGDVPVGLTHTLGVDLAPNDRWNVGANLDVGSLEDRNAGSTIDRQALGLSLGYGLDNIKYAAAAEYRVDETRYGDGTNSELSTWLVKNSLKYQINPDWRLIAKYNHSESSSNQSTFYAGEFTEAVLGYGYRPVDNDRWNTLFKYTYFYNLPGADQVTLNNTAAEYIQKSHILSLDVTYDLSRRWSLGGKYAHRLGQVSQDRANPEFFDSEASLYILRADWHFVHRWDLLMEARLLDLPDAQDRRSGALFGVYRHLGDHFKFGVGYNYTDFSDDLTDLDYDSEGVFINLVGKM